MEEKRPQPKSMLYYYNLLKAQLIRSALALLIYLYIYLYLLLQQQRRYYINNVVNQRGFKYNLSGLQVNRLSDEWLKTNYSEVNEIDLSEIKLLSLVVKDFFQKFNVTIHPIIV